MKNMPSSMPSKIKKEKKSSKHRIYFFYTKFKLAIATTSLCQTCSCVLTNIYIFSMQCFDFFTYRTRANITRVLYYFEPLFDEALTQRSYKKKKLASFYLGGVWYYSARYIGHTPPEGLCGSVQWSRLMTFTQLFYDISGIQNMKDQNFLTGTFF